MNIPFTGDAGYLGSHTAVVLAQAGHDVVLLDSLANSDAAVPDAIRAITGKALPFVHADVRYTARVAAVLRDHRIQVVIHFAGLKAVGESVAIPLEYYANNVQGTVSLLQAMQRESVKTLVFSSGATVYGLPQYLPIDEAHPTSSVNPYGRTKLHVMDLAEGHAIALQYLSDHPGWDAINLGTGQGCSVLDIVHTFGQAIGRDIPYAIAPRRAGDVTACYADPGKAARLPSWRATRSLSDMCASTWRFQQHRP